MAVISTRHQEGKKNQSLRKDMMESGACGRSKLAGGRMREEVIGLTYDAMKIWAGKESAVAESLKRPWYDPLRFREDLSGV